MNHRSRIGFGLLVVGIATWLSTPAAAAPWDKLLTFERVEADPNKTYTLTENGPWVILACVFRRQCQAGQRRSTNCRSTSCRPISTRRRFSGRQVMGVA